MKVPTINLINYMLFNNKISTQNKNTNFKYKNDKGGNAFQFIVRFVTIKPGVYVIIAANGFSIKYNIKVYSPATCDARLSDIIVTHRSLRFEKRLCMKENWKS